MPEVYFIDNTINKFIGTWQWSSGTDTVTIKLKKIKYKYKTGDYSDELIGTHYYVKNGIIIENFMNIFDSIGPNRKGTISLIGQVDGLDTTYANGGIKDSYKHKSVELTLKFIPDNPPKLLWFLRPYEGIILPPAELGQTLPRDLILTKQ